MCKIIQFPTKTAPTTQQTSISTSAANSYAAISSELLKKYWVAEGFPATNNLFATGLLAQSEDGSMRPIATMSGSLCSKEHSESVTECSEFIAENQPKMLNRLSSFVKTHYLSNAIVIDSSDDGTTVLMVAPSDRGIYVAAWFTEEGNVYLAKRMATFMLYCFAAMNCKNPSGEVRDTKLEKSYREVQDDLSLGLDRATARHVLAEYYGINIA